MECVGAKQVAHVTRVGMLQLFRDDILLSKLLLLLLLLAA